MSPNRAFEAGAIQRVCASRRRNANVGRHENVGLFLTMHAAPVRIGFPRHRWRKGDSSVAAKSKRPDINDRQVVRTEQRSSSIHGW
jgi:hypothetical protein